MLWIGLIKKSYVISCQIMLTYLRQAVKDPLLAIEKQWRGWDGRFPKHMLLYTNPEKQHKEHQHIKML